MMFGFACRETPELMPLPIALAHRMARRLAEVRKSGQLPYLRPDGKTQVTVEYEHGVPKRVRTVVVVRPARPRRRAPSGSAQDIVETVILPTIPRELRDADPVMHVNPTGRFVTGGPMGDAGLTGRKIIVDSYGGMARHGGGAFSGKDPTKVDRSAAYAARWVAKNVVAAGLADRFEVEVAYGIGIARPISLHRSSRSGPGKIADAEIQALIERHFDLRPASIIAALDLRRPIYRQTAAYGHFGRPDLDLPWERTDKAALLAVRGRAARPELASDPAPEAPSPTSSRTAPRPSRRPAAPRRPARRAWRVSRNWPTSRIDERDQQHHRGDRVGRRGDAAADLAEDVERERRRPAAVDERRDQVVVERERERQQEAGHDRRQELREGDLPERPPRRAEEVVARLDMGPIHARQAGPDEQQHEADVEQGQRADDRVVPEPDLGAAGDAWTMPSAPDRAREEDERGEGDDELRDDDAHVGQARRTGAGTSAGSAAGRAPPSSRRSWR